MMLKQLVNEIKNKFGTRAKFYRCSDVKSIDLERLIAAARKNMTPEREKLLKDVLVKVHECNPEDDTTTHLQDDFRQIMFDKIQAFGGVIEFCKKHTQFNKFSVYAIIDGKRPRRTKKVNELIDTLEIDTFKT